MKDDFLSTVSHELRTPLTSIRAFSEILLESPDMSVDERQNFLGIITKETERLTRLINQVLDMAKLESGRTEWRMAHVDVHQVIEDAIAAASSLFSDRQVSLETRLAGRVPAVLADQDKLMQVMLNLLSNAVKFVPAGSGQVAVHLSSGPDLVRVEVRDNGPGIAAEDQEMIFEKFRQGGDSLTGKPQGTGLGLPISRQIMEHFGGRLWVESGRLGEIGQGSCFVFELPHVESGDNAHHKKIEEEDK
jgi:signal transduction histidine kinase